MNLMLVGLILVALVFLVAWGFCFKSWGVLHLLLTFCVFCTAVTTMVFAAASLKTRSAWHKRYADAELALKKEQDLRQLILEGNVNEVRQTTDSLRSINGRLARTIIDRGRVWSGCTPQGAPANNSITLSTVPAPVGPVADPAAAPAANPNRIQVKMVLQGFREVPHPALAGVRVPTVYLGEFTVTAATDTTVTLSPLSMLDALQNQAITAPGTWALYEVMPIDSHRAFAVDIDYQPDLEQEDDPIYGVMDKTGLEQLFASATDGFAAVAPPGSPLRQRFDATIAEYVRDGTRAEAADSAANTYYKVRFLRPKPGSKHSFPVDVAQAEGVINSQGYFDSNGMAIVADLRRPDGSPVEFEEGGVAVVDTQTADDWVAQGWVEKIEPVFVRPLYDFVHLFHRQQQDYLRIQRDKLMIERDQAILAETQKETERQIQYFLAERTRLQADVSGLGQEVDAVTKYREQLEREKADAMGVLSRLYRDNQRMAEQLRAATGRLTRAPITAPAVAGR